MTAEEHNKYVWWGFLAHGLFQILMLLLGLAFAIAIIALSQGQPGEPPAALIGIIVAVIAIVSLIFVSPSFIAAYAVKNKKSWARIASIIVAAMSIMNMPFGTLSGIHALWFFCGDKWLEVYPQESSERRGLPPHNAEPNKWQEYTQAEDGEYVYRTPEMPDWR